nr:reverse transcriptase domain-containing protein [Tanacetum cinerariifolium]
MLSGFFQNQSLTSSTLPSNTIPNPKGEMKAITTRSDVAYEGHSISTPKKVVERETKETKDKEQTNFQGSTAYIQPPVTPIPKPDVPKTLPKPNIPYHLRLNDQNLREKATNQMEKLFQIFQDLHFDISFADALLLMPKFSSTIKCLLTNKDKLFELAKIPLNENCSAMLLKKLPEKLGDPGKFLILCDLSGMDVFHAFADLGASINIMPLSIWKRLSLPELTPTQMTLELAYQSITRPKGVVKDVFVKVGKYHLPTDFVVVDFEADPRIPLILGRSFLRTDRAIIDVYGEEIIIRFNDEAVTFNLNQTTRYSSTYDDLSVNRIDIIDVAREEYAQEILEAIDAYLKDESISLEIDHADCGPEGDICLIEKLLNNDPFQLPQMDHKQGEVVKEDYKPAVQSQRRINPKIHEVTKKEVIKLLDAGMIYQISDSPWVSPIHCVPKKGGITIVENENNELIPTRLVTGWRVCIDYRKLNDATRKDHFPLLFMDQMLDRLAGNEFYCFLDGFSGYFQILINPPDQEKTTFTCPYGTFAYRRMPFGLYNAPETFQSDFASGSVLGQRKMKHFQPIHYASKTMTKAQNHYNTMEKETLSVVYAFEKFRPYLFLSKSIVYTDHSALKYLLSKQDAKPRSIRWLLSIFLVSKMQSRGRSGGFFSYKNLISLSVIKKGTENLAADHLSRLDNPHKDVFENKDINENFPLETLGKISSGSTPWFADFANFHAGNFIVKGISSQQKKKFFKDVKHYF